MTTRRFALAAALLCGALLSATACAPDGAATPSSSASATSTGASASSSPSASAPTSSPTSTASAQECLVGTWGMDQAALDRFYGDVNAALDGAGVTFTPHGSARLVLGADGAFTWTPDVSLDASVSGTMILVTIAGDITGTYATAADRITTTQSTSALQVAATIDGAPTEAGAITDQIASAPVTDAAYTCAGDTLTLVSDIGGATATSVLTRQ